MKLTRLTIVAVLALLVSATVLVGTAAGDQAAEHARPFKISMEFAGSVIGPPGTHGCDSASLPARLAISEGHGTHLGLIAEGPDAFVCQDLETGALTNGSATYLAANGDTVDASFEGQAYINADGTFTGEGTATILGGSGRFVSASGAWTWTMSGMFLPDGTTLTALEGAGWIAYDASDRSD